MADISYTTFMKPTQFESIQGPHRTRWLRTRQPGILRIPSIPCHDWTLRAHCVSPGLLAILMEVGMSGMERIHQFCWILANCKQAPATLVQREVT
jgi:hypothetical protein